MQMGFYPEILLSQNGAHFIAVSAKVDNANRRMQFISGQTSKCVLHCGANYIYNWNRGRAVQISFLGSSKKWHIIWTTTASLRITAGLIS